MAKKLELEFHMIVSPMKGCFFPDYSQQTLRKNIMLYIEYGIDKISDIYLR